MAQALGMATQLTANAVRFGWYSGINWLLERHAQRIGRTPRYTPQSPVPTQAELMADLRKLFLGDALAVRKGLYPPAEPGESFADHLRSVRAMFADLPATLRRRAAAMQRLPQGSPAPRNYLTTTARTFTFKPEGI